MKKKVLISYNYILHYRKPFFNELANYYEITVVHSGSKSCTSNDSFDEIIIPSNKAGPFYFQFGLFKLLFRLDYDVVIYLFDLRWICSNFMIVVDSFLRKKKVVLWGAWYTKSKLANKVRLFFSKVVGANAFYSRAAMEEFVASGLDKKSAYVANNTFHVPRGVHSYLHDQKFRILFVGSLDSRKRNHELLQAFSNVCNKLPEDIILTFIGDGLEMKTLIGTSISLGLQQKVEFVGRVENPVDLEKYYLEALVSVSFGQAGLSVLQSLGFGVPFLTSNTAITGGERSNVIHGFNGFLCDASLPSLQEYLLKICADRSVAAQMGKNAYDFYDTYCSIENMVQGFRDSIEGTRFAKVFDASGANS